MSWYYGTYSCGHEGRTNIIGPTKNRQWKADREFEKLCPECWEKQKQEEREKTNAAAAEKAKEMELPDLTGSEKQVAWANTLRQALIEGFERMLDGSISESVAKRHDITIERLRVLLDHILTTKTSASWYIESRGFGIAEVISWLDAMPKEQQIETEKPIIEEIKKESTVWPENCQYKEPAEIKVDDTKVTITFPKDETFRKIVKGLEFEWGSGYWFRKIDKFNGPASDRAAELGNKLLNAGFPVTITDNIIRQNAISGNYQPEQKRWIYIRTKGDYEGRFAINWGERDEKLYNMARKLPGSKWSSPSVIVKINYWQEVEDFARLYGFKFSEGALEAIEVYKKSLDNIEKVVPSEFKEENPPDGLREILNSGDDILDDLKD